MDIYIGCFEKSLWNSIQFLFVVMLILVSFFLFSFFFLFGLFFLMFSPSSLLFLFSPSPFFRYAGFIINDPYYSDHNRHIREATDYLLGTVAKKAARRITESTLEAEAQVLFDYLLLSIILIVLIVCYIFC